MFQIVDSLSLVEHMSTEERDVAISALKDIVDSSKLWKQDGTSPPAPETGPRPRGRPKGSKKQKVLTVLPVWVHVHSHFILSKHPFRKCMHFSKDLFVENYKSNSKIKNVGEHGTWCRIHEQYLDEVTLHVSKGSFFT